MARKARVSEAVVALMGDGEHHAWTLEELHTALGRRGKATDFSSVFRAAEKLAADGLAFVAAGGWCGLNFWRCRQAHCMVNAAGWLGLSLVAFAGAALGRSLIYGDEQLVFLGVLLAALGFEGLWYLGKGTNVIVGTARGADPRGDADQ